MGFRVPRSEIPGKKSCSDIYSCSTVSSKSTFPVNYGANVTNSQTIRVNENWLVFLIFT